MSEPDYKAFAIEVMEAWPDTGLDGADLQEMGESHGLLIEAQVTEYCGEGDKCGCREYVMWENDMPWTCYKKAWLK